MPSRGVRHDSPALLAAERRRRGLTKEELAKAVERQFKLRDTVSVATVTKIESGRPVDAHRYWPVLVVLGAHVPPSLDCPRDGQQPGDWLRDIRESHGLAPAQFCAAAVDPRTSEAMSRSTLARVEAGANRRHVRLRTFDSIHVALVAFGLPVELRALWNAWANAAPESVPEWDAEYAELRARPAPVATGLLRRVAIGAVVQGAARLAGAPVISRLVDRERIERRYARDPAFARGFRRGTEDYIRWAAEYERWRAERPAGRAGG